MAIIDLCIPESEAGGLEVWLHSKPEASPGYVRLCLTSKNPKQSKEKPPLQVVLRPKRKRSLHTCAQKPGGAEPERRPVLVVLALRVVKYKGSALSAGLLLL